MYKIIKRLMDFIIASVLFVVLLPLIIITAIVVWRSFGLPLLFKQKRPGLANKPFCLYKFRTMTSALDEQGNLLSDEQRLTDLGKFLRRWSLDELPQLINVIKGDISLVGPRPLLMEYLDHYTPEQARRHLVRPGITGLAQIKGRNALSWEQKFQFDIFYVDHQSLMLDIKILFLTARAVFSRKGISQQGHVTMPKFTGKGA